MLAHVVKRFVGPKAMVAVLSTLIIALGLVLWRWQAMAQEMGSTQQQIAQYEQALVRSEAELQAALQEQRTLNEALAAQRQREQQARARAQRAERALTELEESDEGVADWLATDIPRGVREWLRDQH